MAMIFLTLVKFVPRAVDLQISRKFGSPVTLHGVVSKILLRGDRQTITNTEKLTAIEVVLKR